MGVNMESGSNGMKKYRKIPEKISKYLNSEIRTQGCFMAFQNMLSDDDARTQEEDHPRRQHLARVCDGSGDEALREDGRANI